MYCRFVAAAAAAIILAACSAPEPDPVRQAVQERILIENPGLVKFDFTKFEKVRDVTLSDELTRRQALFATKYRVLDGKATEYRRKRMPANASKNAKEAEAAKAVLDRIEAYRARNEAVMDSVIYSVFVFDGFGKDADGGKVTAEGQFAVVSPTDSVYGLKPAGGNPSEGMGIAIPGYFEEIIGRDR